MLQYLVCYDIEDNRARLRAARELLSRGDRVQRSVFEIQLRNRSEFVKLQRRLQEVLGEETNVRFYRLTAESVADSSRLDGGRVASPAAAIIL